MAKYDFVTKRLSQSAGILLEKLFPKTKIGNVQEIQYEFKTILERSADLLFIDEVYKSKPDILGRLVKYLKKLRITHVEFQSSKDPKMLPRMLVYAALIYMEFGYWPTQYVIYLHEENQNLASMLWDEISSKFLRFRVHIVYLCKIDADKYINDPDLGVVVFSSVMKFPKGKEVEYYKRILTRIKEANITEREKFEHIEELTLLTGLKPK